MEWLDIRILGSNPERASTRISTFMLSSGWSRRYGDVLYVLERECQARCGRNSGTAEQRNSGTAEQRSFPSASHRLSFTASTYPVHNSCHSCTKAFHVHQKRLARTSNIIRARAPLGL